MFSKRFGMLVSPPRPESKKPIGLLSIYVIILSKMWYNEPIDYVCGVADRKGPLNHRCLLGLWYNEPIDYVCSVAERKGSLNHRYCACYGEKQHMAVFYREKHKFYNRIC